MEFKGDVSFIYYSGWFLLVVPTAPCEGDTFFCHSNMCINHTLVCNGIQNCVYPWDENHCKGTGTGERVELDSSQSSCLCCVPMSREEEAQHPGDSGQHQPHHHRSHLWPGAHPAHHLRHHPAQTTSQEIHHPQVPTLCSAPTCCCFSVKAVYLQLPGWLCFRLIFMLLLVF